MSQADPISAPDHAAPYAAFTLFAAAILWPGALQGWFALTLSPAERLARDAWCGVAPHTAFELLGHCSACWIGVAALSAAGAWTLRR